jgi:hypothetical protein
MFCVLSCCRDRLFTRDGLIDADVVVMLSRERLKEMLSNAYKGNCCMPWRLLLNCDDETNA